MHVLIAALGWGLGHAARTAPLVRYILSKGHRVTLASDGQAAKLWREEFPDSHVHELPGYGVRYATGNLYLDLLAASPRILAAVQGERHWLGNFASADPPDLVISDNRYGSYLEKVPSILISHQLRLQGAYPWLDAVGQFLLDRWLSHFTEIWVPDRTEGESLSGTLSVRNKSIPPTHRLGILSRFQPSPDLNKSVDILVILSGPEPQRSIFEQKVIDQLAHIPGNHVVIRGTRQRSEKTEGHSNHVQCIDLLSAPGLQDLLDRSHMLICRSGYSSLMDLERVKLPALLVPTPGQFEQEYLATRHGAHPHWIVQRQDALDVRSAWNTLKQCEIPSPQNPVSGTWDTSRLDAYLGAPST